MIYQIFGNVGREGDKALIDKVNEIDEGYFLVQNFNNFNYCQQQPVEALNYIRENFEYIGNIDYFEVYHKNK